MAYLFNGTDDRIVRAFVGSSTPVYTWSVWFYPTDNTVNGTIYADYNAARTNYRQIRYRGASDHKVEFRLLSSLGPSGSVVSTGTVNYDEWNHIVVFRGASSPTNAYISLNGETVVDGGAGSMVAIVETGFATALGRLGGTAPIEYFPGMIAEVALWDNSLYDWGDDRYLGLAQGFDPRLIPPDPTDNAGTTLGPLNLMSYSPLIGAPHDLVTGTSWTVTTPTRDTSVDSHPRIYRNYRD